MTPVGPCFACVPLFQPTHPPPVHRKTDAPPPLPLPPQDIAAGVPSRGLNISPATLNALRAAGDAVMVAIEASALHPLKTVALHLLDVSERLEVSVCARVCVVCACMCV